LYCFCSSFAMRSASSCRTITLPVINTWTLYAASSLGRISTHSGWIASRWQSSLTVWRPSFVPLA
jgi:hypothetical protein